MERIAFEIDVKTKGGALGGAWFFVESEAGTA